MSDASIPDITLDVSLAEPTRRTHLGFQLLLGAANLVVGLCNLTIYQALLPSQIALLDPVSYPRLKHGGLCLSSTAVPHIFADVRLWLRGLTHQGSLTKSPCSPSLAG